MNAVTMKIGDFNSAVSAYNRRTLIGLAATTVVGLGIAVTAAGLLDRAERDPEFAEQQLGPLRPLVFAVLGLPVVGMAATCWWASRVGGVRCPSCRASLLYGRSIAVATRNCPRCGRRIFDEPEPSL